MKILPHFLLAACLLPGAARADLDPGNWEITATTQMEGMPQPVGPITKTQCLTAQDTLNPGRVLDPGAGGCEFANRRESGGTYTFDVACSGAFPMRGTGSVNYGAQSMSGELNLAAELGGGKKVGMNSRLSGRRLGPCSP